MVLTIKCRFGIYRRFEKDIWGLVFSNNNNKTTDIAKFFFKLYLDKQDARYTKIRRYIYRIDIINPKKKRKFIKARFMSLRLVKLFYLTLKYKQFRIFAKRAAKKEGHFQQNYCLLLEGRMVSMVYRSNFYDNLFEILSIVRAGMLRVNGKCINYVNASLVVGDILSPEKAIRAIFKKNMLKRVYNEGFVFNKPRYMIANYKLIISYMYVEPRDKDLAFPVKLDIYRATGYY